MLPVVLAEIDGSQIKQFFEVVIWVSVAVGAVFALVKYFKPTPATEIKSPLEVREHRELATKEEIRQVKVEMQEIREQRRADVSGLHRKIESGLTDLGARFTEEFKEFRDDGTERGEAIAALKAESQHQIRQIQVLDAKMDSLPERLIRMLERNSR